MRGSGPERCRRHISRSVLSPRPPPTAGLGCCVHAPHKIFGLFVRVGKGNRQEVHSAGQMPPKVQGKPQPTPAQVANPSPLRMTSPPAHPSAVPAVSDTPDTAPRPVACGKKETAAGPCSRCRCADSSAAAIADGRKNAQQSYGTAVVVAAAAAAEAEATSSSALELPSHDSIRHQCV